MELGARYGTTTCEIAAQLKNSGKLVAVEPDNLVWHAHLDNIAAHGCKSNLLQGYVGTIAKEKSGTGHGTRFSLLQMAGPVPFPEVEKRYNLKFDTLLIDCEGCIN